MCSNKFRRELTSPIVEINPEVQVSNETGREYHLVTFDSVLDADKKVLEIGGKGVISKSVVDKYGMDKLIGVRVNRWVLVDDVS